MSFWDMYLIGRPSIVEGFVEQSQQCIQLLQDGNITLKPLWCLSPVGSRDLRFFVNVIVWSDSDGSAIDKPSLPGPVNERGYVANNCEPLAKSH